MAQEKNMLLRIAVPIVMALAVLVVGYAVFVNTGRQKPAIQPAASATPPTDQPRTPATDDRSATPPAPQEPTKPATDTAAVPASTPPSAAAPAQPLGPLSARLWPAAEAGVALLPIGDLRGTSGGDPRTMLVEFSHYGAGIAALKLANHFDAIGKNARNEVLQQVERHQVALADGTMRERTLVPMSLLGVEIDGAFVNLATATTDDGTRIWKQVAPGSFEAQIIDASGHAIGTVKRRYTLEPGRYDLTLDQRFENTSGRDLKIVWHQLGPVDLPIGVIRYGGDVRRVRLGYLSPRAIDPDQQVVRGDTRFLIAHAAALGTPIFDDPRNEWTFTPHTIWPEPDAAKEGLSLSWAALTNRYFAVAVHPIPARQPPRTDTPGKSVPDKRFNLAASLERVVLSTAPPGGDKAQATAAAVMALKLTSAPAVVKAGEALDASLAFYAGPISRKYLGADDAQVQMGLPELLLFTFGGPCAFCTFQPIAQLLRWYMGLLHDFVVFDWALGIVVLVLTVRTILHPVTRWSQTSLARFSKQMAALAPKQAKIKEKYANEPQRMREEIAKLMKEENVNYAGALGCLPMFLQTPVWIALYAMIFFTFELRHEAGLFGVFQKIGHPTFLADLSEPDRFIPLGTSFSVPLLSSLMGPIDAFNIVPLILGVVFFIQQKYLTPPTTATLTPEQESQQRIMKVMTVVMFPLMMYNAPAALSLYFMTNSTLGIIESRWIRKGIDAADAARAQGGAPGSPASFPPARRVSGGRDIEPARKPGFLDRVRAAIEEKQKEVERQRREQAKRQDKGGKGTK